MEDVPAQEEFDVDATQLVGLEFNADEQCRAQYGPTAVFCPFNFAIDVRVVTYCLYHLNYIYMYMYTYLAIYHNYVHNCDNLGSKNHIWSYVLCIISIRKFAHVCGASLMEDLVQPIMFHLQMVQAVDPPMYVIM